ncbi:MAG: xanthine dehydrogenase accessory protein XdhC [Proteobacteria bacterium]|uniref:xanthine dehydrogenase accessory protein XdhC n=1 Tax=Aquabacterium sp. TaxID=1872578 RepID=UPI0035C66393|nr:xanthine dehydrogenase accessory protein XdhC [Pseudomonadota bacterium]
MHLSARNLRDTALAWRAAGVPAIVVEVQAIRGSTPREAGTRMLVAAPDWVDGKLEGKVEGTVGGGHLEWQAIALARQALADALGGAQPGAEPTSPRLQPWTQTFALGPSLGQCCGGSVCLGFAPLDDATLAAWALPAPRFHLELHGAGHVGQAIARLLADVDCSVRWIDERPAPGDTHMSDTQTSDRTGLPSPEALAALPGHIRFLPSDAAEAEVRDAPAGACHLVLTHRHDLDLRIVHAILQRGDFAFLGMIGSRTKRATFERRLRGMGHADAALARLACPIGLPDLAGKEPAVIAISAVAQLLQRTPS